MLKRVILSRGLIPCPVFGILANSGVHSLGYILTSIPVNTRQYLSTDTGKTSYLIREGREYGLKTGCVGTRTGDREGHFCKTRNELCRNEPYLRRISSFLHNLIHQQTNSCTQALYQNLRAELALHPNFDTIEARVHFGANGCGQVH